MLKENNFDKKHEVESDLKEVSSIEDYDKLKKQQEDEIDRITKEIKAKKD